MSFNSFVFAIFFPVVLMLYWALSHRLQNAMLLIASYVFYGYWDWRFLSLIAISTIVDYVTGIKIDRENSKDDEGAKRRKKMWLTASICTNIGLLGFFKYFNFFIDSFGDVLATFNVNVDPVHLSIILPVGISFYTFQTMSYTIDIYRGKLKHTRRFIEFALYVSFFPQLVAGPIERARNLLPRILNKRWFNREQFQDGLHLIFWGLFKKVYVADNLAPLVNRVFSMANPSAIEVIFATYAFAFQIYCDFSGYSDIARGCAKCMGIELRLNFNFPYVAINPADFWRRWHISLSSWLRDYLYISLGGNRRGEMYTYRNLALTMLLGGLWHGASWIFVLWGAYQGVLLIGHRLLQPFLTRGAILLKGVHRNVWHLLKIFMMFQVVCFGWLIFRASSVSQVWEMAGAVLRLRGPADYSLLFPLLQFAGPMVIIELIQLSLKRDNLHQLNNVPVWVKTAVYSVLFYLFAFHGATAQSFIYFQF